MFDTSTRRENWLSWMLPRRMSEDEISACSARIRVASCSALISSEKKPTWPPSIGLAMAVGRRSRPSRMRATWKAMLVASEVLPMAGRPARMMRSDFCRPPISRSRSAEAGGHARQRAVALIGFAGHLDGFGERVVEGLEAAIVAALLGEVEERLFGFLDLLGRGHVDVGVIGRRRHLLADLDQRAADGEVVDRLAVIGGVDDGGRLGGEAREVLRHASRRRSAGRAGRS